MPSSARRATSVSGVADVQPLDAGQAGDLLRAAVAVLDEERLDQVVDVDASLAHQRADGGVLPVAARTADEIERRRVGGVDHGSIIFKGVEPRRHVPHFEL